MPAIILQTNCRKMIKNGQNPPCVNVKIVDCGQNQFLILNDQVIGTGASAVVKRALNKSTSAQYAVKIIKLGNKQQKQIALKQLQIVQQLQQNPNLVHIEKIKVQSANHIYIFMEYCNGGALIDEMKRNQCNFTEEEVYTMFCHIINGYKVLYDAKVLHEDIKPENILIKDGIYKISDFGIAIFSENYKYTSQRRGTLYYMAFEKLTRKQYTANVKSDIYSLGVMFYEVITGRHPYVSKKGLTAKQYATELKDARMKNQNITDRYSFKFTILFDIVQRMVAKSQDKRISWEELYQFYSNFEPLEKYKDIKPIVKEINSPFRNASFKEIDRSHASISGLQLEIVEREAVPTPKLAQQQSFKSDNSKTEELKEELTSRRSYAYFLMRVIKSIEAHLVGNKQPVLETLLMSLYLYRPKILPVLDYYDPSEQSQSSKAMANVYQQDSKFVKQQQSCHLIQSQLPQLIKKELVNKFKGPLTETEQYIGDLIKNLFNTLFVVIRIYYKKEITMLLYLITLMKILKKELPQSQETFDRAFGLEEGMLEDLRKFIQNQTFTYMVMFDPDKEEESEEFQVLDWEDYLKGVEESKNEKEKK